MARIIFMGTPEFAVPALQALHSTFGVTTVVTAPDKPKGRGLVITPSAVKTSAQELGILNILQPTSLKDQIFQQSIQELQPDIICVIAFRILPKEVYKIAKLGSFNVHASLLPKYRGAAPINHAIINGEQITGVTSFLLNDIVDTGTILLQRQVEITDLTTAGELYSQLMPLAAQCAVDTCSALISGSAIPLPQNDELATPAPKVFRETSAIDWNTSAKDVRNFIHGLSPSPCAWFRWNLGTEQLVKVYRCKLYTGNDVKLDSKTGSFLLQNGELYVCCSNGILQILELQFPGKPRVYVSEWARGFRGETHGLFL